MGRSKNNYLQKCITEYRRAKRLNDQANMLRWRDEAFYIAKQRGIRLNINEDAPVDKLVKQLTSELQEREY